MRKNLFFGLLIAGTMALFSTACSSDDDNSNNNSNVNVEELSGYASSGTWIITNYEEEGENETYHFTGYNFVFNTNGTVIATNGNNSINGSWSVSDSDSSDDDDSSSDADFILNFNVPETANFDDLNDDWDIESYTNNRIELIDISGGNGGTDRLVFEKN